MLFERLDVLLLSPEKVGIVARVRRENIAYRDPSFRAKGYFGFGSVRDQHADRERDRRADQHRHSGEHPIARGYLSLALRTRPALIPTCQRLRPAGFIRNQPRQRRMPMLIGCPCEIKNQEYRVGLTPESSKELVRHGHSVLIESGAGSGIGADDEQYRAAGAEIVETPDRIFA